MRQWGFAVAGAPAPAAPAADPREAMRELSGRAAWMDAHVLPQLREASRSARALADGRRSDGARERAEALASRLAAAEAERTSVAKEIGTLGGVPGKGGGPARLFGRIG